MLIYIMLLFITRLKTPCGRSHSKKAVIRDYLRRCEQRDGMQKVHAPPTDGRLTQLIRLQRAGKR
ncbi:hypothetical protein [Dysgonomonas termitidis]|uniref:Uncharacterized protein n=1 Tax=Dysgonomonas termitidis TaxID=1516126 RepID=A0ABV9KR17_9BACT